MEKLHAFYAPQLDLQPGFDAGHGGSRLTCPRLCAARRNNRMDATSTTEPARATAGDALRPPLPHQVTAGRSRYLPLRCPEYDLEEPSMAEKLAALNLPAAGDAKEELATTDVVPPSTDSVHVLHRPLR